MQKKHQKKYYGGDKENNQSLATIDKLMEYAIENIFIPDAGISMVNQYTEIADQLINKHSIKNIIVSSPTHSMQLVGKSLKKRFGEKINFIADFRDSWNTRPTFGKHFFISDYISRKMERGVLSNCDHFTYVSEPILTKIEDTFHLNIKSRATLIMNGFNESIQIHQNDEAKKRDKIKIGYFGTATDLAKSNLSIHTLLEVLKPNPEFQEGLEFYFYGALGFAYHDPKDFPCIQNKGSVSHADALKKMGEMDFLLLLYSDPKSSDEVITGKIFEYISRKKPIICLSPKNMEARRIIEMYGIGITIDIEDPKDIKKKIESLPTFLNKDFYKDLDISQFKRENQYKKFLELLQ
ncbi:hypothetical protein ACFLZQ_00155, partial [Thermodesulfobacteriota bacterium]